MNPLPWKETRGKKLSNSWRKAICKPKIYKSLLSGEIGDNCLLLLLKTLIIFRLLFMWLRWVLVEVHSIFDFCVACGIFSCHMWMLSCIMWDVVPWPEIETRAPALGVWSLSHWTTREVPAFFSFVRRENYFPHSSTIGYPATCIRQLTWLSSHCLRSQN